MAGHSRARLEDPAQGVQQSQSHAQCGPLPRWLEPMAFASFVRPDNGARWGREGNSYNGTCRLSWSHSSLAATVMAAVCGMPSRPCDASKATWTAASAN